MFLDLCRFFQVPCIIIIGIRVQRTDIGYCGLVFDGQTFLKILQILVTKIIVVLVQSFI